MGVGCRLVEEVRKADHEGDALQRLAEPCRLWEGEDGVDVVAEEDLDAIEAGDLVVAGMDAMTKGNGLLQDLAATGRLSPRP